MKKRKEGDWVLAGYAPNKVIADMLASALRADGIPVILKKPRLADFPTSPGNPRDIYVPRGLKEKAKEFLDRGEDESE